MIGSRQYEFPEDEGRLLRAVANGDQQAFRLLVEAYWRRVYGNTLALVKSTATAQELTQDIFMKIWTQRDKLAAVESFGHYIYVVGRNQVISALRKKLKEPAPMNPDSMVEHFLLPDLQVEFKETYQVILDGIELLTPRQRLIFKMSRMEGMSHDAIAVKLHLSKNTVKVHMVAALNLLRVYIKERLGYLLVLLYLLVG